MQRTANNPRGYAKEFREKAVRLVLESGYTIDEVAKQLGCSTESIRRWKHEATRKLDPEKAKRIQLEENENKRLRKRVAQLEQELDIVKKAMAYFAKDAL